jgi:hypothetical protein
MFLLWSLALPSCILGGSSMEDWVGVADVPSTEEPNFQGNTKETVPVEEGPLIEDVTFFSPKRQSQSRTRPQGSGLAMSHSPTVGVKDIKDETAATLNEKKIKNNRLPNSLKSKLTKEEILPLALPLDQNQPVLQLVAMDLLKE